MSESRAIPACCTGCTLPSAPVTKLAKSITCRHAYLVQEFDPSDRDSSLQSCHNGVDRVLQTSNSCHNLEVKVVSASNAVYLGKATTAAMTHSGKGWRRTVAYEELFFCLSISLHCILGYQTCVITPRVPSLPRKSSVRLYPADVFLSKTTTSALKMKCCT